MQIDSKTLLCRYRYDALNRLVASAPTVLADTQRFYLKDRLTTEIQGAGQRSIMQHEDQLLAQQQRQSGTVETRLLATDQQRSVLNVLAAARRNPLAYTPYGHRHPENGLLSLLGFNGERPDPVTGHYLLGNGYRAFNPVLMRFNSPDSWSPFGEGGLNAYAYSFNDPVNYKDETGHMPKFLGTISAVKNKLFQKSKTPKLTTNQPALNNPNIKNFTKIGEDAYTYESSHKGKSQLTIHAHGGAKPNTILVNDTHWTADDILKNIDLSRFDRVRLLACNSDALGAELALKTQKEVKAYIGTVNTNHDAPTIIKMHNFNQSLDKPSPEQFSATLRITKKNPFNPNTQKEQHLNFNYRSVRFQP